MDRKRFAAAFAEWDRRWREDPDAFQSDVKRILAGESCETYGEQCAAYFQTLLAETATTTKATTEAASA